MPAYAEVFQRIEKKYRLDADQRRLVEEGLSAALAPDAYGRTRITSLYLDTPERSMIDRSLEKPLYKEKLRLRAYGAEAGDALVRAFAGGRSVAPRDAATPVFLEIKKKFKGVVYKRRVGLSLGASAAFLAGAPYERAVATWPLADPALQQAALMPRSLQIARELEAALARHDQLVPSMAIACERVAWAPSDPQGDALRVTFDDHLAYCDLLAGEAAGPAEAAAPGAPGDAEGLEPAVTPTWHPVIPATGSVMEIKNAGPYPAWLVHLLDEARAYPASFSKYGTAYRLVGAPTALVATKPARATQNGAFDAPDPRGAPRIAGDRAEIAPAGGLALPKSVQQGATGPARRARSPFRARQTRRFVQPTSPRWLKRLQSSLVKGGRCA